MESPKWKGWTIDNGSTMHLYKITRDTHIWKKGQKVWEQFGTGALASSVYGKFRGKGRWIRGWIHYQDPNDYMWNRLCGRPNVRYVGKVTVKSSFKRFLDNLDG